MDKQILPLTRRSHGGFGDQRWSVIDRPLRPQRWSIEHRGGGCVKKQNLDRPTYCRLPVVASRIHTDSQVFAFDNDDGTNGQLRSPGVLYRVCVKGGGEEIETKLLPNTVGISGLFSSFCPPSGLA